MENKNVLVNRLLITLVITVITFCSSTMCKAQYLINQTYMKPMPTFTTSKQACTQYFNNGTVFKGTKHTTFSNGSPITTTLYGTFYYSNGDRLMSASVGNGFDAYFNIKGNDTYYYIRKNGELIMQQYNGTQKTGEYKSNKKYYIEDHCIHFYASTDNGGYIGGGYTGGGGNNSGSSSRSSNKVSVGTQCAGCHGNGKCGLCHGKAYNQNGYKCSRCHGTGRCQTCAGVGKLYF